jgi:hypothetical protein
MNATRNQRRTRTTRPALENLDLRIAPAVMSAVALAAEIKVESHQVARWETSLTTANPGSHRETVLSNHIARTEGRLAVQETRLGLLDTAAAARNSGTPTGPVTGPSPIPGHPKPILVSPPITFDSAMPTGPVTGPSPIPGHPKPILVDPPITFDSTIPASTSTGTSTQSPVTTNTAPASSLPANVAQALDVIYNAYEQDPSTFSPSSVPSTNGANLVQIQGTNVGIQVQDSNPANFNTLLANLQSAGMQVTLSSANYGMVVGFLPIAQLPTVAALADAPSITPVSQLLTN